MCKTFIVYFHCFFADSAISMSCNNHMQSTRYAGIKAIVHKQNLFLMQTSAFVMIAPISYFPNTSFTCLVFATNCLNAAMSHGIPC